MIELNNFEQIMQEKGWYIFHEIVPLTLVNRMLEDMNNAYQTCRQIQESNGIPENNEGTVHHLIELGQSGFGYAIWE